MLKLHLGCGKFYKKGFINIDINKDIKADEHMDVMKYLKNTKNESVDYIYSNALLEHLQVNLIVFIGECFRVLKQGGILHLKTMNAYFWKRRIRFLSGSFEWTREWHPYHTQLVKPTTILQLLNQFGFETEVIKHNKGITSIMPINFSELIFEFKAVRKSSA